MLGPPSMVPGIVALAIALVLTPLFRTLARSFGHVAVPNERSSHVRPTPQSGGIAILIALVGGVLMASTGPDPALLVALAGAAVLSAIALVDERRALPRGLRLIGQIAVAVAVVWGGGLFLRSILLPVGTRDLGLATALVTLIWIVGVVNVYNFMDGANGLAAMQAVVGGAAIASLVAPVDPVAASLAIALVGAAAGFLPWNFPRASIFMGDAGSTAIGLVFAALVLRASGAGVPFIAAALPLAPFLLDASVTIAIRIARGEAFFSTPHRLHFYQRLLDRGWTHPQVTAVWTGLALISAVAALSYPSADATQRAVTVGAVILVHAAVGATILAVPRRASAAL